MSQGCVRALGVNHWGWWGWKQEGLEELVRVGKLRHTSPRSTGKELDHTGTQLHKSSARSSF